jgi:gluconolactonase
MAVFDLVAEGLQFPEGPIATSTDDVLVVEIRTGYLSRVDIASGKVERFAHCGGGPNGAAVGPDGMIYVCNNGGCVWQDDGGIMTPGERPADYSGGRIQRVDPVSGAVTDLYTEVGGNSLNGPNDIVFDATGNFWFTDFGKRHGREMDLGALYYASPYGDRIEEVAFPLTQPNGVGLSPDGGRLYVAETVPGRLWAWDLASPGRIVADGPGPGGGHLLWSVVGYQKLDSLAVDSAGNVCVGTLVAGAISVVSPAGDLIEQMVIPEKDIHVTNICFGGDDLQTAYITSSGRGRLYSTPWPTPGLPLAFNI